MLYIVGTHDRMERFKLEYYLRMMTVRLIAIATLMSTFITESMCLVRIQLLKVCSPLLNITFSLAEIKAV